MGFKKFEEVPVWKASHQVILDIYRLTASFPKEEKFGMVSQIRRSAASISANIVEGFYRDTTRELIRHLYHARGSCGETIYHLLLARDLKYVSSRDYDKHRRDLDAIAKQLNGWIRSLQNKEKQRTLNINH